jgi:hypothetical protein
LFFRRQQSSNNFIKASLNKFGVFYQNQIKKKRRKYVFPMVSRAKENEWHRSVSSMDVKKGELKNSNRILI